MLRFHPSAWRLTLLSAVLQIVIFPLSNFYFLSWIAVTPLIVALMRARVPETLQLKGQERLLPASLWQGFVLAYVCGILWCMGTCYWVFDTMHRYGALPIPVALLILILFCMYIGLYHGLFGLMLAVVMGRSGSVRRALIAAPFLWVAVELARTRITAFPWELLGYAQASNFMLTRLTTITGVYGLSWEIMLVNSVFAAAFLVPKDRRKVLLGAAVLAAVMLQAGQLVLPPQASPDHTALLVQPNIPIQENWTADYFQGTLRDLSWISLHPIARKAGATGIPGSHPAEASGEQKFNLIVWPESPAPFVLNDPNFRHPIEMLAQQSGAWLLAGSVGVNTASQSPQQGSEEFNSAALISPAGELTGRYDKIHLVPFGEYVPFKSVLPFMDMLTKEVGTFGRGRSRDPLRAGDQRLGIFICYESIFPNEVREFVERGANVLVNISNDGWYGDSGAWKQHLRMTQMRAIENARWLLIGTNTGMTASVDPYGRIVTATERKVRTALIAPYGLSTGTTFYTRHGDWFAYLCAIISLLLVLSTQYSVPRQNRGKS